MPVVFFSIIIIGAIINSLLNGFVLLNIIYIAVSFLLMTFSLPPVKRLVFSGIRIKTAGVVAIYIAVYTGAAALCAIISITQPQTEPHRMTGDLNKAAALC